MNTINPVFALSPLMPLLLGIGAVLLLVGAIILGNFAMVYIRALFSGAKVTITELIALRLRSVPVGLIVDSRIAGVKSWLLVSIDDLSTHFLAGGNVQMVVLALIAARKADFTSFLTARARLI
jgi:uncharacterized protein YqfA (UPF0365 family)